MLTDSANGAGSSSTAYTCFRDFDRGAALITSISRALRCLQSIFPPSVRGVARLRGAARGSKHVRERVRHGEEEAAVAPRLR
eukprot:6188344-Pleurochrysis_carterae.AAC.1